MKYKIGTLARRAGVTTQALRYYEKEGLIAPLEEDGAMRTYHTRNVKWLTSIRRYHEMGFSVREIRTLFSCGEEDQIEALMEAKHQELEGEISKLLQMQQSIRQQVRDIQLAKSMVNQLQLVLREPMMLFIDQYDQVLDVSSEATRQAENWNRHLLYVRNAVQIPWDEKIGGFLSARNSGYIVPAKQARQLGIEEGPSVQFLPSVPCLHTVGVLDRNEETHHPLFERCGNYLAEHGMCICGDAVGRQLVNVKEEHCKIDHRPKAVYYEYWLPVGEDNQNKNQ